MWRDAYDDQDDIEAARAAWWAMVDEWCPNGGLLMGDPFDYEA